MNISAKKALFGVLGIVFTLIAAHLLTQAWLFEGGGTVFQPLIAIFDLDNEASIPTWFAQTLLLASAVIASVIAYAFKGKKATFWRWAGIAVIILFLSIDEGASLHETLGVQIGQVFGSGINLGFITLRDWVLIALVTIGILAIIYLPFIWRLPVRTKTLLFSSAAVFIAGAAFWESLHFTTFGFDHMSNTFAVSVSNVIEEGLELIGASLLLYALLDYLQQQTVKLSVTFQK